MRLYGSVYLSIEKKKNTKATAAKKVQQPDVNLKPSSTTKEELSVPATAPVKITDHLNIPRISYESRSWGLK